MPNDTTTVVRYTAAKAVAADSAAGTVTNVQHQPQVLQLLLPLQVGIDVGVPVTAAVIYSTDYVRTRYDCCPAVGTVETCRQQKQLQ